MCNYLDANAICCPSWFNWQDNRTVDEDGDLTGYVVDLDSKRSYGMLHDPNNDIRVKLCVIAIFQIPWGLCVRMPYRAICLLTGDFFSEGVHKANKAWELERQQWSMNKTNETDTLPPSDTDLLFKATREVLKQLVINIVKVVTYPLAMIAIEFAALYGLILHPLDGRKFLATIEEAYSEGILREGEFQRDLHAFGDFFVCMQPEDVWKRKNLFRFDDPNGNSIRARILRLENKLIDREDFLKNEGLYTNIEDALSRARQKYTENKSNQNTLSQIKNHLIEWEKVLDNVGQWRKIYIYSQLDPEKYPESTQLDLGQFKAKFKASLAGL